MERRTLTLRGTVCFSSVFIAFVNNPKDVLSVVTWQYNQKMVKAVAPPPLEFNMNCIFSPLNFFPPNLKFIPGG
jgi:hypothetical protein